MWYPVKLQVKNFMSYVDETLTFSENQASIIQGLNLTDEGFENNGSGKSALLEALSISILDSTLRSSTAVKDFVRREEKSFTTVLELKNSVTKEELVISREVFDSTSKSQILKIHLNGVHQEDMVSVKDGNKFILEKIGISREDLLNYFLISSEKFESFFSLSDTNKKSLIGRFSNSNLIDKAITGLDINGTSLESERLKFFNDSESYRLSIEKLEELFDKNKEDKKNEKTKDQFKEDIEKSVSEVTVEITKLQNQIKLDQTSKQELELKDSDYKVEVEGLEKQIQTKRTSITQIRDNVQKIRTQKSEAEQLIGKLEMKLVNSVECPECKTTFNPNSSEKVDREKTKESITKGKQIVESQLKTKIENLELSITAVEKEISSLESQLISKKAEKNLNLSSITNKLNSISSNNTLIKTKQSLIVSLNDSLSKFEENQIDKTLVELKKKIEESRVKMNEFNVKKAQVEKKIENNKQWHLNLIKFKTHLSNKVIKVIECFINEYLVRMNTDIRVSIDGYKMNRDNTVKEKISVSLARGIDNLASYHIFSSGEKARVELAGVFAVQKLINTSLKESGDGLGFDFTFLDEIIDSVDSIGMFNIMKTLQSLEKSINVISHVVFKEHSEEMFKTLTVIKKEGIATISDKPLEEIIEEYGV